MRPAHEVSLDEGPRAVADDTDGLARGEDLLHELDRALVGAQLVGVGHAAGQHQGVVVVGVGVREGLIDGIGRALVEMIERLDLAAFGAISFGVAPASSTALHGAVSSISSMPSWAVRKATDFPCSCIWTPFLFVAVGSPVGVYPAASWDKRRAALDESQVGMACTPGVIDRRAADDSLIWRQLSNRGAEIELGSLAEGELLLIWAPPGFRPGSGHRGGGEPHRDAEPAGGSGGKGEGSVVGLGDALDDCQPKADACVVGADAFVAAKKWLGKRGDSFGRELSRRCSRP